MPSIRDLKGKPIDEMVTSRVPENIRPEQIEVDGDEDDEIDVSQAQPRRDVHRDVPRHMPEYQTHPATPHPLPEDFESGLKEFEVTIAALVDKAIGIQALATQALQQAEGLRARAQKDAGKLAKLNDALKALQGIE